MKEPYGNGKEIASEKYGSDQHIEKDFQGSSVEVLHSARETSLETVRIDPASDTPRRAPLHSGDFNLLLYLFSSQQ